MGGAVEGWGYTAGEFLFFSLFFSVCVCVLTFVDWRRVVVGEGEAAVVSSDEEHEGPSGGTGDQGAVAAAAGVTAD